MQATIEESQAARGAAPDLPDPRERARARRWGLLAALACLALVAATRLPILLGPHVIADGDEAVLGLMARRLAAGDGLPLFFSGQRYGLSIVETASAALAFRCFGASAFALKLAMLPLFALGVWLAAAAARRLAGERAGWLVLVLLALAPAFGGFASKARGGYSTAFALAALVLFLGARGVRRREPCAPAGLGLALGGVLAAQPLWLLPLLPFAAWRALSLRWGARLRLGVCALVLPLASLGAARWLEVEGLDWSPSLANRALGPALLLEWPRDLCRAASGAFYLREVSTRGILGVTGCAWALAVALALAHALVGRARAASASPQEAGPRAAQRALALGALLASGVALPTDTPRYLLPALMVGIVLVGLRLAPAVARRSGLALAALTVLAMTTIPTLVGFRSLPLAGRVEAQVESERAALDELIAELRARGVAHVYCEQHLLQWILMFESGQALVARWHAGRDRVPAYTLAVDRARAAGQPTAWVGYREQLEGVEASYRAAGLEPPAQRFLSGRYFFLEAPPWAALRAAGFEPAGADREAQVREPAGR